MRRSYEETLFYQDFRAFAAGKNKSLVTRTMRAVRDAIPLGCLSLYDMTVAQALTVDPKMVLRQFGAGKKVVQEFISWRDDRTGVKKVLSRDAIFAGQSDLVVSAAAMIVLAENNIPTDIQELLIHGSASLGVPPCVMGMAIKAAFKTLSNRNDELRVEVARLKAMMDMVESEKKK